LHSAEYDRCLLSNFGGPGDQDAQSHQGTVDASVPCEREYFVWCGATPGFGLRVHPSGKKVFIAQVRVGRQTRRVSIGHYGPFTVDQARSQAQEIIRTA
jgi:hypothetical protein